MTEYKTISRSSHFMEIAEPVVIEEHKTTRKVIIVGINDAKVESGETVSITIVHQRKKKNDEWEDVKSINLNTLKGGDGVKLKLNSESPPFKWDEERRFLLRCELDAAFFHLYLGTQQEWKLQGSPDLLRYFHTPREAVEYVMETFPIVKRKDEAKYGEYRTKRVILKMYDEMAEAMRTGQPYQTRLDPPPANPRVAHEAK